MSKFNEVVNKIWQWINDGFAVAGDELEKLFAGARAKLEADGKQVLALAAEQAVAAAEAAYAATPRAGVSKMDAALAAVKDVAIKNGLDFIENEARALIELALLNLRNA